MEAMVAMVQHRPEVVANVVVFAVLATAERGWPRSACWLVTGALIAWAMEFSSIRLGFPFGRYAYRAENFPDELWFGGVPLFASLSFAALSYFGYSAACTLCSPLRWRGAEVERVDSAAVTGSLRVCLLAALLTTWMDVVIDPVTHLGKYWRLGDLYAYTGPGLHFDVPLSNYAGWFVTIFCIVRANQYVDGVLRRGETAPPRGFALPWRPLWGLAAQLGTFVYMLGVTLHLMAGGRVPGDVPLGRILISGAVATVLYVTLAAVLLRRGFARSPGGAAAGIRGATTGSHSRKRRSS
jgi:putative membrane protein